MKKMIPIPKDALFYISTGEYSDYCVTGVFRALQEIDADSLLEQWLTAHPEQRQPYKFKDKDFLTSVAHLMQPVESWEWHIESYAMAEYMYVSHCEADK
jgi:hypothetical protein